jgi:excisionase family DNA binding protein
MKSYSVEQISKMLNTNPETVRRWIRNDKLHATRASKKSGWEVSEEDLKRFLTTSKKYSAIAATIGSLATAGVAGILPVAGIPAVLAAGTAISSIISSTTSGKKIEGLDKKAMSAFIESSILAHQAVISQKKDEIEELKEKIRKKEEELAFATPKRARKLTSEIVRLKGAIFD